MKILMLHGHYSDIGGSEVVINNQITGLRKRGHEVLFFCFGNKNIDEKNLIVIKEPESNLLRYVYQFLINPKGYARLKQTIKSFKPDIIHLHNIDKHILTFLLPVKNYKTIRSIHDFGIVCPSFWGIHKDDQKVCEQGISLKCIKHKCLNPFLYPLYYYLFKIKHYFQKRMVHGYITATYLMKKYMETQGFKNISVAPYFTPLQKAPSSRWGVNAFFQSRDVAFWKGASGSCRRGSTNSSWESPGSSTGKHVLYVGKLEENKGCESLIKAFRIVIGNIPNAKLTIVGSGTQENKFESLSRYLNIGEDINFVGSVSNNEIAKYYRDSAVVVVPSICMDNSPIVIYEALSFGKPVVATNRGGIPELIKNGHNGFLVNANNPKELADAIINVISEKNAESYKVIAGNAVSSSLRYSLDKYIDNLEAAYNKL